MSESTETVQSPEKDQAPADHAEQFEAVAALLRGDKGEKTDEATKQEDTKTKPRTLKDLAGKLGISIEELYNVEVGMPGSEESSTLGSLKDLYQQRQATAIEQMRWQEQKSTEQGAAIRARTELTELMSLLPKESLRPEVLQKVREKHSLVIAREKARTLEVIPEWQEESTRSTELGGMREHLVRAGFEPGYLDQITDHRTMRYIRENFQREQRILAAMDLVKSKPKVSSPPSSKGNAARVQPSRQSPVSGPRNQASQISQISKLLNKE
jgi:hypothetical protein